MDRVVDVLTRALARHARFEPPPLVPELAAFVVDDVVPLWTALEADLAARVDSPYFAVPWPGAQALARVLLDGIVDVRGRRVVDLGCGSGIASVAAARCGAARVESIDVDPLAIACAGITAARHDVVVETRVDDAFAMGLADAEVVLVGDLASRAVHGPRMPLLYGRARAAGATLVVADSGRPFFAPPDVPERARYVVPVPKAVEGVDLREVRVFVVDP